MIHTLTLTSEQYKPLVIYFDFIMPFRIDKKLGATDYLFTDDNEVLFFFTDENKYMKALLLT